MAMPQRRRHDARAKRLHAQCVGLAALEGVLADLADAGVGMVGETWAVRLEEQARRMADAYLPGLGDDLRRLAGLVPSGPGSERMVLPDVDRLLDQHRERLFIRMLLRLWAVTRRGHEVFAGRLDRGELEADPASELDELLGHAWELSDLQARGEARHGLRLIELADERRHDPVRGEQVEEGFLLDLGSGDILVDRKSRPLAALEYRPFAIHKDKESWDGAIAVEDAWLHPGFLNRRIRWAANAAVPVAEPGLSDVHDRARPTVDAAVLGYREQIRRPTAPEEAVLLLRVADIRMGGDDAVLLDPSGGALVLRDQPLTTCPTTALLVEAAAGRIEDGRLQQPASLAVRMHLGLEDDAVLGQPLALVVGSERVRLGS